MMNLQFIMLCVKQNKIHFKLWLYYPPFLVGLLTSIEIRIQGVMVMYVSASYQLVIHITVLTVLFILLCTPEYHAGPNCFV